MLDGLTKRLGVGRVDMLVGLTKNLGVRRVTDGLRAMGD